MAGGLLLFPLLLPGEGGPWDERILAAGILRRSRDIFADLHDRADSVLPFAPHERNLSKKESEAIMNKRLWIWFLVFMLILQGAARFGRTPPVMGRI